MPTILTNGIQLPDKGSVDWYSSMQSNYNLIDTHLGNTDIHVTTEDKANWDGKANASHTHTSSELTDIGDFATKQYVDNSISGLVDNAPDALNTLNELSAALNDDSNFASTVTTTLGAKANSADLATVATSGSYTDLTDKPTINDSTITIQKNGSTVDTFTTNGSAKTIDIPVPTKTSDLTNDSNFVDTSNSAVASGITSAKVIDYDAHIANTEIHVTSADKQKWNNGISQAYVTRYTATSVSDNSTVAYSDLNNTDNIKIGDFILDVNGKLFAITAVDTANETVSVTTPLTQLAVDSSVIHKTGNETKSGELTVTKVLTNNLQAENASLTLQSSGSNRSCAMYNGSSAADGGGFWCYGKDTSNGSDCRLQIYNAAKSRYERVDLVNSQFLPTPSGELDCGGSSNKWKSINGLNPGSLSLPDFSNAIDISGYITVTDGSSINNNYTPLADGYISVNLGRTSGAIGLVISNGKIEACVRENTFPDNHRECGGFIPVQKNDNVVITSCLADSIIWAYFIPCQGNV